MSRRCPRCNTPYLGEIETAPIWVVRKYTAQWRESLGRGGHQVVSARGGKGRTCKPCAEARRDELTQRAKREEAVRQARLQEVGACRRAVLDRTLSLRKLHERIGRILAENDRRNWSERNDLPVILVVRNGDERTEIALTHAGGPLCQTLGGDTIALVGTKLEDM